MTQIAEAYFHLKRVELSQDEVQIFGDKVSALAALTAIDLFPPDSVIDVRLEEGSLKGWVLVIGTLALQTYGHVADYKGFKESISEIVSDAKGFSEAVSSKIFSQKELEGSIIYRRERRTKTPGRIKRIIQKREWLDAHQSQLSQSDVARLNYEIEQLMQMVLADIPPGDRAGLRKALGEQKPKTPPVEQRRVAIPLTRPEQVGLFDSGRSDGTEVEADYHRRFLLSEGLLLQHMEQKGSPSRWLLTEIDKPDN